MTAETAPARTPAHVVVDPAILYFGTPVALLSTQSAGGTPNLAPMSSVFWLGRSAVLGMGARSRTAQNILATHEVVINLPSSAQVDAVDRLALTTGVDPVSQRKAAAGYRFVGDKFAHAALTPAPSDLVAPPRAAECPVALEARLTAAHGMARQPVETTSIVLLEVEAVRVHVHPNIRMEGTQNRIDPDRWKPLLMSFQRFYGVGDELRSSRLSTIDEEWYR